MKKIITYLILSIIVASCEDDDLDQQVSIDNVSVLNIKSSALVAKVLFETNTSVKGKVSYWKNTEDESASRSSVIGKKTMTHSIPLLALSEMTEYNYRITWEGSNDTGVLRNFTTKEIPNWVKAFYKEEENTIAEEVKGYYLFHNKSLPSCMVVVNEQGKIVWYRTSNNDEIKVAKITEKGTLLTLQDNLNNKFATGNTILESTFDGDTLSILKKGVGEVDHLFHHDMQIDSKGNIVALVEIEENGLPGEGIEVFNENTQKIWEWSSFDGTESPVDYVQPWSNSISINEIGDYIVSFRKLSQIWKIDSKTGNVTWKLGKGGDFTLDSNSEFLFQHYAVEHTDGRMLMFDNGSIDVRPKSRILELSLNKDDMTAQTSLSYYLPTEYFSQFMGSAKILDTKEMLLASGTKGKVISLNADGSIKWTFTMHDKIYRVEYFKEIFD